jgi:hypothetical protein
MLRSGYSSAAVIKELAARHFADEFSDAVEAQLQKAGASPDLMLALRRGTYAASPAEIAAAQKDQAARVERQSSTDISAPTAEPSRSSADKRPAVEPSTQTPPPDQVYRVLKDSLVVRQRGVLVPVDSETLRSKKLFLYFFSAISSPVGRHFTSVLSEYYQRMTTQHPEFEVVFFSGDRSQFAMENHMNQTDMPWPAVEFSKVAEQSAIFPPGLIHDLPTILVLDGSGKLLTRSADASPAALEKVLVDLDKILQNGNFVAR